MRRRSYLAFALFCLGVLPSCQDPSRGTAHTATRFSGSHGGFSGRHGGGSSYISSVAPSHSASGHAYSHGGHYVGGVGSSHRGGTYVSPSGGHNYGRHK